MNAKKASAKAPPQRGDDAIRDANFRQARRFHRDGMISLADYYKQILDIFKFEPKNKYVEELEDTGESDATSISDISDENNEDDECDEDEEQAFETSITECFLESIDNIGNNVRANPGPSSNIENPSISSSTSITSVQTAVTSAKSSATSVQSNETEQATCDLCQKNILCVE